MLLPRRTIAIELRFSLPRSGRYRGLGTPCSSWNCCFGPSVAATICFQSILNKYCNMWQPIFTNAFCTAVHSDVCAGVHSVAITGWPDTRDIFCQWVNVDTPGDQKPVLSLCWFCKHTKMCVPIGRSHLLDAQCTRCWEDVTYRFSGLILAFDKELQNFISLRNWSNLVWIVHTCAWLENRNVRKIVGFINDSL